MIILESVNQLLSLIEEAKEKKKSLPEELMLRLDMTSSKEESKQIDTLTKVAKALESGFCPKRMTVELRTNNLKTKGAAILAKAIVSGNCPHDLTIDSDCNTNNDATIIFSKILESVRCPQHLTLKLNIKTIEVANALTKSLASEHCPKNLILNLDVNDIGAIEIAKMIINGHYPQNLNLLLECVNITDAGVVALAEALESGQCPRDLVINIVDEPKFGDKGLSALVKAFENGRYPKNVLLSLMIDRDQSITLAKTLICERYPQEPTFKLVANPEAIALGKSLVTRRYPVRFKLYLNVDLHGHDSNDLAVLLLALECGYFPSGVTVHLQNALIEDAGAEALAKVLERGRCPEGLILDLTENEIGDVGMISLARALASGKCPRGLEIKLSSNLITKLGAVAIAKALESGRCPKNLYLDLFDNTIDDEGVIALANAIKNVNCPQDLTLEFGRNEISSVGEMALVKVLESNICSQGLILNQHMGQSDEGSEEPILERIDVLLRQNENRHAALSCSTLQQGWNQTNSQLSLLPKEILLDGIYPFLEPFNSTEIKERTHFQNNIQKFPRFWKLLPTAKAKQVQTSMESKEHKVEIVQKDNSKRQKLHQS